jgi:signal transduction histidine kinase
MVVTGRSDQRAVLDGSMVHRFVSVFADVSSAVAAAAEPPRCRRVHLDLGNEPLSSRRARLFVRSICHRWRVADLIPDAEQIATELVENSVQHAESHAMLRLELRRGLLTVAVSDDSSREAVLVERISTMDRGIGLRIVSQRAKAWGCSPRLGGGKVVWAVLPVPDVSVSA